MSRLILLAATIAIVASCAPAVDQELSPRAAMRFDSELAGRVAGPRQNCLSNLRSANVVAARGNTLLFRSGGIVYANDSAGGCSALADSSYALVTDNFGGRLCRGTLARVVDPGNAGTLHGTCVLGDFTPYRQP